MRPWFVLPLPRFVLRPYTAVVIAAVHVYLGIAHLGKLLGGEIEWTHVRKGFGFIGGANVFAALASRGLARPPILEGRWPSLMREWALGFGYPVRTLRSLR